MKNDRLAFLDCEISCDVDFLQYKNAQVNPAEKTFQSPGQKYSFGQFELISPFTTTVACDLSGLKLHALPIRLTRVLIKPARCPLGLTSTNLSH